MTPLGQVAKLIENHGVNHVTHFRIYFASDGGGFSDYVRRCYRLSDVRRQCPRQRACFPAQIPEDQSVDQYQRGQYADTQGQLLCSSLSLTVFLNERDTLKYVL